MDSTKATWKIHHLGEVAAAVASSPSLRQAAKKLGVNVSTISRLVKAGKVAARPGRQPRSAVAPPSGRPQSPAEWGASVRALYELTPSEDQLVVLAVEALLIARDPEARPSDRLAGMRVFAQLTKQLQLPQEAQAQGDPPIMFPSAVAY